MNELLKKYTLHIFSPLARCAGITLLLIKTAVGADASHLNADTYCSLPYEVISEHSTSMLSTTQSQQSTPHIITGSGNILLSYGAKHEPTHDCVVVDPTNPTLSQNTCCISSGADLCFTRHLADTGFSDVLYSPNENWHEIHAPSGPISLPEQTNKSNPASLPKYIAPVHISLADNDAATSEQPKSRVNRQNFSPNFFLEKIEKVLDSPSQIHSTVEGFWQAEEKEHADLTESKSSTSYTLQALYDIYQEQIRPTKGRLQGITEGIQGLAEVCAFILSQPPFDILLFKQLKKQYPQPAHSGKAYKKINHVRTLAKLTHLLQTLKNLHAHPDRSINLKGFIQWLSIDEKQADQATSQAFDLLHRVTTHPNIEKDRLTPHPASSLCKKGISCQTSLFILKKIEERYSP